MATIPHAARMEHFPVYPKGFIVLRYVQLLLSLVCVGLGSYFAAVLPSTASILMLFTAIMATIIGTWIIVAHTSAKAAYNYWAVLIFECILTILWLTSFALLAVAAQLLIDLDGSRNQIKNKMPLTDAIPHTIVPGIIYAVASTCGALNFVLYIVTLVIHSRALHQHRQAGGKALRTKKENSAPVATGNQALDQEVKASYQPASHYDSSISQQSTAHDPHNTYAEAPLNSVQAPQQLAADRPVAELQSSSVPAAELPATTQYQQYPVRNRQ